MSRAFVREDREEDLPRVRVALPDIDDPGYDAAAAFALIQGAKEGTLVPVEQATGFRWGDPDLHEHVRRLIRKEEELPEDEQDRRFLQLARRFLTAD